MKVNSVVELEDKSVKFEGELSPTEAALVVAFGLNTLVSVGLTSMIPSVGIEELDEDDEEDIPQNPAH